MSYKYSSKVVFIVATLLVSVVFAGAGLYPSNSNVQDLNKSNFAKEVLASPNVWLVEFYAPWCGHCKNLVQPWEAAATNLKGIVRVGAVNCDDERELCGMYGVKGFPTIKFFPSEQSDNPHQKGLPWKKAEDYQGARSAAAIARFATDKLPNHVSLVTEKSHPAFLENKSDLGKVLLFTDKKEVSSLYKAMAIEFKDRLVFGQVQFSAKALTQQYDVTKSPTLLVVPSGQDPVVYSGPLKPNELIAFLSTYAAPAPNSKFKSEPPKPAPTPVPEVEVNEVLESTDQESFQELCLSKGVCGLAILDNSSDNVDAAAHEAHLATLLAVAKAHKKQARFTWVDGFKHPELIKALDIGADYPQLVIISPRKKGFAQYLGSFEEKQMGEFVDRVASGRKRMIPLDALPTLE